MTRTVRDVRSGRRSALHRYRAERLLRRGFPELRSKVIAVVRSQLGAKGVSLDHAELEACYSQAWQGLYSRTLAGEQVESPSAWLVTVTFRRAIDEARSNARVADRAEMAAAVTRSLADRDVAAELDDRDRLRQVFEALRLRLSKRECEAASLCYLQGLSRSEAAARMGISESRMRKLMEGQGAGERGLAGKLGDLLATIGAGGWCEQQSSLIRAYAFGLLDPDGERHMLAIAHTRDCPACRMQVAMLRGLAAVLPPLPLLFALEGAGRTSARVPMRHRLHSLTAKLAATGLALAGAGAGYLVTRPSRSPAPARVSQTPSASVAPRAARAPSASPRSGRRRKHRATPTARSSARSHRRVGGKATQEQRGTSRPASEFSPEHVRGEAPPAAPAAPLPPSGKSGEGEFGIEPGG